MGVSGEEYANYARSQSSIDALGGEQPTAVTVVGGGTAAAAAAADCGAVGGDGVGEHTTRTT